MSDEQTSEAQRIAEVLNQDLSEHIDAMREQAVETPLREEFLSARQAYLRFLHNCFDGEVSSAYAAQEHDQFREMFRNMKNRLNKGNFEPQEDPVPFMDGGSPDEDLVEPQADPETEDINLWLSMSDNAESGNAESQEPQGILPNNIKVKWHENPNIPEHESEQQDLNPADFTAQEYMEARKIADVLDLDNEGDFSETILSYLKIASPDTHEYILTELEQQAQAKSTPENTPEDTPALANEADTQTFNEGTDSNEDL